MSRLPPHLFGTFLTVIGVLVLTPDALLVRLIDADVWTILFWRGIFFACGIFGFYFFHFRLKTFSVVRQMGRKGLQASVLFACSTLFFVQAIENTSVANVLVIIAMAPFFSALLSRIFLKETVSRSTWIAILVSCGGIGIIFLDGATVGGRPGDYYAFVSALSIAAQITTVRHAKHLDMVPSLGISGLFVAAFTFFFASPLSVSPKDISLLILLGVFVLPIAFGLITVGPRYITAAEVSLIMLLETFIGPLWVWLIIGEVPPGETLIGGGLVLTTLAAHALYNARSKERRLASAASGSD